MLACLLLSLLPVDLPATTAGTVEIRVMENEGWKGGPTRDIKAVFDATARDMLKFFPDRKLKPIIVDHSTSSPIVLYAQGPNGETLIRINSTGTYWSQFAYQFAHEMTHVLCGFEKVEPNSPPNMWFEESLCMMGSLFAMRQMEQSWKTSPPYPNWKDYGTSLGKYADDVIQNPKHKLPTGMTLAQWFQENEVTLRTGSTREMQSVVASVLLPMFEASPESWPAVGYLNMKKTGNSSFKEYLDAWQESVPKKHKAFVGHIRAKFKS